MCTPSPCSLATKRAPAHFSCSTRQPGAKSGARSRTTDSICSCSRPGSRSSSVTRPPVALRSAANALHEAQRASRLTAVAVPGDTTISSHRAVAAKTSAGSMSQRKARRDARRATRACAKLWQVSGHATSSRLLPSRVPGLFVSQSKDDDDAQSYGKSADTQPVVALLPSRAIILFCTKRSHTSTHFEFQTLQFRGPGGRPAPRTTRAFGVHEPQSLGGGTVRAVHPRNRDVQTCIAERQAPRAALTFSGLPLLSPLSLIREQ